MIATSLRLLLISCLLPLGIPGLAANETDTPADSATTADGAERPAQRNRPERANREDGQRRRPDAQPRQRPDSAPGTRPEGGRRGQSIQPSKLVDSLVVLQDGEIKPLDKGALDSVGYYAIYFASAEGRNAGKFTDDLANAYKRLKAKHPEFEVVFVSVDKDEKAFESHVKGEKMPWPILGYDKTDAIRGLSNMRERGGNMVRLIFIDAEGKVIAPDPAAGREAASPQAVLKEITKTLNKAK